MIALQLQVMFNEISCTESSNTREVCAMCNLSVDCVCIYIYIYIPHIGIKNNNFLHNFKTLCFMYYNHEVRIFRYNENTTLKKSRNEAKTWSVILINLSSNFTRITLHRRCFPVCLPYGWPQFSETPLLSCWMTCYVV